MPQNNHLVAYTSQQAEQRRAGKKGQKNAEAKALGSQYIPQYEDPADLRDIERLLAVSRDNPTIRDDIPGNPSTGHFPMTPQEPPLIRLSPLEMIAQNRTPMAVANLREAITSATAALRPHLDRIAEDEMRNAYYGGRFPNKDTIAHYRTCVDTLRNQYIGQRGGKDIEDIDWPAFAEWFLSRQWDRDLKPATWRVYRTAIIEYLQRIPGDEAIYALAVIRTEDEVRFTAPSESKRVKKFRLDDYDRVIFYCHNHPSDSNRSLMYYLRASLTVGLRPSEYLTSAIRVIPDKNAPFGRQAWLFTCNAKYTNGRANGPIRCIDLSQMDASAIKAISNCIDDAQLQHVQGSYKKWLSGLNRTLRNVEGSKKSGLSNHYTAYSARHQAIANWKSLYDSIKVAALAGHAMPNTAIMHYGKAKDAWPVERLKHMMVRPSSADVNRIHNRVLMANERHEQKMGNQPMPG
jgi:hypothetical protein